MVAKAVGLSLSAAQRIWKTHNLQTHRLCTFKKSRYPNFVAKVEDIVGHYMNPPAYAVVVSIDEKNKNPCFVAHPAGAADEARQVRHHDPRL